MASLRRQAQAIRSRNDTIIHGRVIDKMLKDGNILIEKAGIIGYYIYNRVGAAFNKRRINKLMKEIQIKKYLITEQLKNKTFAHIHEFEH